MKKIFGESLRAKLFVSVSVVLCLVAILNYTLPEIWFRKELLEASKFLNAHIEQVQERIRRFSSFLVIYKLVEGATELDGIAKVQGAEGAIKENIWEIAKTVVSANPGIGFVEVSRGKELAHISVEDAELYFPLWAPFEEGMIWLEISQAQEKYVGIPNEGGFLLFSEQDLKEVSLGRGSLDIYDKPFREKILLAAQKLDQSRGKTYTPFATFNPLFSWQDSLEKIFQAMTISEKKWVEKINLIKRLIPWQKKEEGLLPAGFLEVSPDFKEGAAVLRKEAFPKTMIFLQGALSVVPNAPELFLYKGEHGTYLDMIKVINEGFSISCGFSLSSVIQKMAEILEKPIIIEWKGGSLGFDKNGKAFNPQEKPFAYDQHIALNIDLKILQFHLYTPKAEALALPMFLHSLYRDLSVKVSLSLLGGVLISFVIALILLGNLSKKITHPITLLSEAFEELGQGKTEGLILPDTGGRNDEVGRLVTSFRKMVQTLQDRDKIRGVLNKVVSKEISEKILKGNIELGGEERTLTMLFSDIRNFTKYSEGRHPKELVNQINQYMTRMCRIVDRTHGVIDKFVGDEIMALYGAPIDLKDHPIKAIEAAIAMMQELQKERLFDVGIGIHTGLVCAGNIGAENRLNYTVIGSNVNLSSRICGKAAPMQILISEATYQFPGVSTLFQTRKLEPTLLKGIDHPVQLYEVCLPS